LKTLENVKEHAVDPSRPLDRIIKQRDLGKYSEFCSRVEIDMLQVTCHIPVWNNLTETENVTTILPPVIRKY